MSAKGKECCEPLKEPEKAIIGLRNLELIMLSVGESEPPSDWQETFKIIPETEEERYARLTGIRLKRNGQVNCHFRPNFRSHYRSHFRSHFLFYFRF